MKSKIPPAKTYLYGIDGVIRKSPKILHPFEFVLLLLLLNNCSTFFIGEIPKSHREFTKGKANISYEFIGWENKDRSELASVILQTFHESGIFGNISSYVNSRSEVKIQIISAESPRFSILLGEQKQPVSWAVEKKPGRFLLFLLNRVLAYRTYLIFPIFYENQDYIIYKIWKNNTKIAEFSYSFQTLGILGWLSLGLAWMDDEERMGNIIESITAKFLKDSEGLY
ncbi:hypothetical protein LEP1GSC050_1723 [Leptospira broomii serovar Hurstbridge str. 5399]|uniref:Uncharacterized protein n=1 Tax=Leptospira broomii serovar Hurstbridge str. 5399 TaxID=1049789 RepID=T0GE53_9LEPT|nr:hypothetical protein [Leptospira broomii]EQA43688.1 hypothetical protein LEP1GSC050_1723 [Leptospira broomii serovar Hurstbridge str. 5399]